jgi:hypothetical protein
MHIEAFTPYEQNALRECVAAVRALSIYNSPDFEEVFGNSKTEVESVYEVFPNWDFYDEAPNGYDASGDVIRNAFAWLLSGSEEERRAMYATLSFDLALLPNLYEKIKL